MANRYWVGGTASWHNSANWSTSSGGAGGASVPTSSDDVYIDGSASNTISLGSSVGYCRNMNWTNYNCNIDSTLGVAGLRCYGNWSQSYTTFPSFIYGQLTGSGIVGLLGGASGFPAQITYLFGGSGWPISVQGYYICNTDIYSDNRIMIGTFAASGNSSFDANGNNLFALRFDLDGGTILLNGLYLNSYTASGTVLTVNSTTGVYKPVITHSGQFYTLQANGRSASLDFYLGSASNQNINIYSDDYTGYGIKIYASDSTTSRIGTLTVSNGEPINFQASVTHKISTFALTYSGYYVNSFSSISPGTRYTIENGTAGQTNSFSYLAVQDSIATGATNWQAYTSNGCVDNGNNVNWQFSPTSSGNNGAFMQFF